MSQNEQDKKPIVDIDDNDDNSTIIDKIINIFRSDVTTGLLDIDSEPSDSDCMI